MAPSSRPISSARYGLPAASWAASRRCAIGAWGARSRDQLLERLCGHRREIDALGGCTEPLEQRDGHARQIGTGRPRRDDRRGPCDPLDEQREQLEAVVVGPLQIVEHEQDTHGKRIRRRASRHLDHVTEQVDHREPCAFALDAQILDGRLLDGARRFGDRAERREHARQRAGVLDRGGELRVVRELGREVVDHEVERAIRHALALVAPAAPADHARGVVAPERADHFLDQRALADARRAGDEHEPAARRGVVDARDESRDLGLPADEPRRAPDRPRLRQLAGHSLGDLERARPAMRIGFEHHAITSSSSAGTRALTELARGRTVRRANRDSACNAPPNGGLPVTSSYATTPSA